MGFIKNLFSNVSKPEIDMEDLIFEIAMQSGLDEELIETVLICEENYLIKKGVLS